MYNATYVSDERARLISEGISRPEIVKKLAHLCLGWPYVYAAAGETCTPAWRRNRMGYSDAHYADAIKKACPVLSGTQPNCDGCQWVDCRCFDCRGFTGWLLKQVGISLTGGGATTQYESNSNWVVKGTIDKMPRSLVCCVFKRKEDRMSHTGMHMEDGHIIHCSTIVKEDTLPGKPSWTHYAIPAGLYTNEELKRAGVDVSEKQNVPVLRRGSQGPEVRTLQTLLNQWGADLKVDGIFGKGTEQAVKNFQSAHKLTADGVVGPKTRAVLDPLGLISEAWNDAPVEEQREDRAEVIWHKLMDAVGNPYGVAGIMGNLMAESGLNPENLTSNGNKALGMTDQEYTDAVNGGKYTADQFIHDGYAYGLAQWCYYTRKAHLLNRAVGDGVSIGYLPMQVDFLISEMKQYKDVWKAVTEAESVREASDAMLLGYEKPKDQGESVREKRTAYGKEIFDRFAVDMEPDDDPVEEPEEVPDEIVQPVKDTVAVDKADFQALKAAYAVIAGILRKYEQREA